MQTVDVRSIGFQFSIAMGLHCARDTPLKMSKTHCTRKFLATTICHLAVDNSYLGAHKKKVHFGPWMESITGSFPFCSCLIAVFTSPGSFPTSKKPHFQNEAKCKTFFVTMSFIYLKIKHCFHSSGFQLVSL